MADDDWYLEKQGKVNAGLVKAKEAAASVNGHVISPGFDTAKPDKTRTDFNDMARIMGKDTVRDYIQAKMDLARSGKRVEREEKRDQKQERVAVVER